ncbi:hypothetical protein [Cyanobium sp. Morenito 9A2]|uniref:hypothetical protein n=1 Tax=Cyanobium sp. Morenito 9A2 TaxID=2823718 RepID=UPI0020CF892C|nr:hypothetical protein [Cyanobium sp. Morenito 9A2]MCP9848316.1 hypothetical protein [Cyanobium sp. Morenito 9A2]
MKGNPETLPGKIRYQYQGKRHIPVEASAFEEGPGRAISWTLRVTAEGFREAVEATEQIREDWSSTNPEALPKLV